MALEAQKAAGVQANLRVEDKERLYETLKKRHEDLEQVFDETLREKVSRI